MRFASIKDLISVLLFFFICKNVVAFQCMGTSQTKKLSNFALGPTARNGLSYDEVRIGDGRRVLPGDTVYCYYVGSYKKGPFSTVFDQTSDGEPFIFPVGKGQVIKGWDLGICGFEDEVPAMYVGGKRRLKIPSALGYGAQGAGPIPSNQDLEFDVEILSAGKEGGIDGSTRVLAYGGVLGFVAIVLFLGFNILSGNWGLLSPSIGTESGM